MIKYKCPSCGDDFERENPGDDFCPFCDYEYVGDNAECVMESGTEIEVQEKLF